MRELVLKPKNTFHIDFRELWEYRELFYFLAWRDIRVRYKQTAIGVLWAVLQPLITTVVFTVFFGRIVGIQTGSIPYPVFAFLGLLFWNFFSNFLSSASDSMVINRGIIQKVYFPRLIIPLSSALVFVVDFALGVLLFFGLALMYNVPLHIGGIIFLLFGLFISFIAAAGLGLFFAAVNVKYRDVRYALPFFIQLIIFVSPVIYPINVLNKYRWLWYLNPLSGVLDSARNLMFATAPVNILLLASSAIMSIALFLFGLFMFKITEKWFADVV